MEFFPTPPMVGNGFCGATWIVMELNTSTYLLRKMMKVDYSGIINHRITSPINRFNRHLCFMFKGIRFKGKIMTKLESGKSSPISMSPSSGLQGQAKTSAPSFPGLTDPVFDSQRKFIKKALSLVAVTLSFLAGCTSIPVEERESRRAEINRAAEETIATLSEKDAGFSDALENAEGYFAGSASATTVAVIGGAYGIGVLVDLSTGERTYLNIKRFDLGAGLGVQKYRGVMLAGDRQELEDWRQGGFYSAVATDAAAGKSASQGAMRQGGQKAYIISDSGAALTATARLAKLSVNEDLTDTGLSEISIPNIGMGIADGRAPAERRTWNRKLPFMAQKVIDMGYDLPPPFGVTVLYTDIEQDQVLENLEVGFSGGAKEPFEWVEFQNAVSFTDTWQVIGDVWVLPFLNVFGFIGDLTGDVTLDVLLDGNGMLEQLEVDCGRPGNLVLCNFLQDRLIELPIRSKFSGNNYGFGFNLAGGWKGFFFTAPVSFSWADMDTTEVSGGAVISASPRVGRLFKLGNAGNLGVYVGGSYLDSDLSADGSLAIPETDVTIDYTVDQSNLDRWAGILGANWDINGRWSLMAEYNGFFGSRKSWIGSVAFRF